MLATPPFPSYVSGHSTFSAAAAAVLEGVFGPDVAFTATSDGLPGVTRRFSGFAAAAAEAGQSRIYGGIHFQFDNADGLAAGRALGEYVSRNFLTARTPPPRGGGHGGHPGLGAAGEGSAGGRASADRWMMVVLASSGDSPSIDVPFAGGRKRRPTQR